MREPSLELVGDRGFEVLEHGDGPKRGVHPILLPQPSHGGQDLHEFIQGGGCGEPYVRAKPESRQARPTPRCQCMLECRAQRDHRVPAVSITEAPVPGPEAGTGAGPPAGSATSSALRGAAPVTHALAHCRGSSLTTSVLLTARIAVTVTSVLWNAVPQGTHVTTRRWPSLPLRGHPRRPQLGRVATLDNSVDPGWNEGCSRMNMYLCITSNLP